MEDDWGRVCVVDSFREKRQGGIPQFRLRVPVHEHSTVKRTVDMHGSPGAYFTVVEVGPVDGNPGPCQFEADLVSQHIALDDDFR